MSTKKIAIGAKPTAVRGTKMVDEIRILLEDRFQ